MTISATGKKNIMYLAIIGAGLFFYFYYGVYKILYVNYMDMGTVDFMHGFFAADNFFNGRTIYTMPPLVTPYPYFPPITFIYMPFVKFGETGARMLWFMASHILTGIAFLAVYSYGSGRGKLISAAAAAVTLFSMPLYQMLFTGNINILIFSGLALVYAAILSGKSAGAPAALAFFSAIKMFPAVMMGVFIRRRNYSACAWFVIVLAVLAAISFAVFGVKNNLVYVQQLPSLTLYSSVIHAMSLTFFIKLLCLGVPMKVLLVANIVFLASLAMVWWKISAAGPGRAHSPGMSATDLFALTVIMVLVAPSSWLIYCALFIMPFYSVVYSLLEGRRDFKNVWVFIPILLLMNFWEIIYYHLPLSLHGLTIKQVWLEKSLHPFLYPLIFSAHFAANLALFWWIMRNYPELGKNFERIRYGEPAPAGPKFTRGS